jgi:hypothetical protein
MSTLAQSLGEIKKPWQWLAIGGAVLLIWGAVAFPTLNQSRLVADQTLTMTHRQPATEPYTGATMKAKLVATGGPADAISTTLVEATLPGDIAVGHKIIRTSSIEIVVQHPSETAEKIAALAESMGGYVESAEGGGQNATSGRLTIRVPAARFEQARTQIRTLGLRVENETIDAQDVTRQYVDQDASIRNLRAEETQYLAILKQATTVKDLLAVSGKLSEVRGQIEQQQAEFNALSKQIETVSIAISLRTESEAQMFGLNWRPGYQLKLALRDGLESVANYATAVTAFLFYLPAVLLWVGTIVFALVFGWRLLRWAGRRWFGWTDAAASHR